MIFLWDSVNFSWISEMFPNVFFERLKRTNLSSNVKFILPIFSCRNMNKLCIKYQSYPKSTKIDAFQQKYNATQP